MLRLSSALMLAGIVALGQISRAADDDAPLGIGDKAPAWSDLPGIDGKTHSLADLKDKDVVVVVFTCNSCPYAVDYEDRIAAFSTKHAAADSKVALVAINVNKIAADSLEKMKERAKSKDFSFPYLYDDTQKIAKDFSANYTPEFFVLNKDRRLVFKGAMDDNTKADQATVNYVDVAVAAALKGEKPAKAEAPARGCKIRFARERK